LGIENIKMLISIYKNWLNDAHVCILGFMNQFMKMEEALLNKNEDVIDKIGLFKLKECNNRL
jgi:hypothetical protein